MIDIKQLIAQSKINIIQRQIRELSAIYLFSSGISEGSAAADIGNMALGEDGIIE